MSFKQLGVILIGKTIFNNGLNLKQTFIKRELCAITKQGLLVQSKPVVGHGLLKLHLLKLKLSMKIKSPSIYVAFQSIKINCNYLDNNSWTLQQILSIALNGEERVCKNK